MGSAVHARSLFEAQVDVMGMICYEMIGYFSDAPYSQSFPDPLLAEQYPNVGNFIIVVGVDRHQSFADNFHSMMQAHADIDVEKICLPLSSPLAGLSDQRNYWGLWLSSAYD